MDINDDWLNKGLMYILKHYDAQIKDNCVELLTTDDDYKDTIIKVPCPGCGATVLDSCVVCQRPKVAVRRQRNLPPKVKIDSRVIEPTWSDDD